MQLQAPGFAALLTLCVYLWANPFSWPIHNPLPLAGLIAVGIAVSGRQAGKQGIRQVKAKMNRTIDNKRTE